MAHKGVQCLQLPETFTSHFNALVSRYRACEANKMFTIPPNCHRSKYWEKNNERKESTAGIPATRGVPAQRHRWQDMGTALCSSTPVTWQGRGAPESLAHIQHQQEQAVSRQGEVPANKQWWKTGTRKQNYIAFLQILCYVAPVIIKSQLLHSVSCFSVPCSLYSPYVHNRWINAVAQCIFSNYRWIYEILK